MRFPDAAALAAALDGTGYLAGDALSTALFLAVRMGQPILLEGEPGVGKTEAAKALAVGMGTTLVPERPPPAGPAAPASAPP